MPQTKMKESSMTPWGSPRFRNGKAKLIAGLRRTYTGETMKNIPAQWRSFASHIGKIPGQVGRDTYGVCWPAGDGAERMEYLSGVEVSGTSAILNNFTIVGIPAARYAVFRHQGHVSRLRETIEAIWSQWLPHSGCEAAGGTGETPDFFERYTGEFDAESGMGGMEVWLPIKS